MPAHSSDDGGLSTLGKSRLKALGKVQTAGSAHDAAPLKPSCIGVDEEAAWPTLSCGMLNMCRVLFLLPGTFQLPYTFCESSLLTEATL